jgi:hypothetical protein
MRRVSVIALLLIARGRPAWGQRGRCPGVPVSTSTTDPRGPDLVLDVFGDFK